MCNQNVGGTEADVVSSKRNVSCAKRSDRMGVCANGESFYGYTMRWFADILRFSRDLSSCVCQRWKIVFSPSTLFLYLLTIFATGSETSKKQEIHHRAKRILSKKMRNQKNSQVA